MTTPKRVQQDKLKAQLEARFKTKSFPIQAFPESDLRALIQSRRIEPRRAKEYTTAELAEVNGVSDTSMRRELEGMVERGEAIRRRARIERVKNGRRKVIVAWVYRIPGL